MTKMNLGQIIKAAKAGKLVTTDDTVITGGGATVVNDLTTGGTTSALSAEQGKIINGKLEDAISPLTVSLTISPATAETGSTVSSTVANWTCSKAPTSQTFEGATIDATLRTKTYPTPLTANKTFTLTDTTNGGTSITKTATLTFANGIYYGKSSSVTYNSALITSLTNKVLSNTKVSPISVTAGVGEYIYYALPTRLGTPTFTVGGFPGGFAKVATITFTNSSGYAESYDIYRSDNANLGATTAVVS